jgi:hypothetical protein
MGTNSTTAPYDSTVTQEWISPDAPGSPAAPAKVPAAIDEASQLDEVAGFGPLRHEEEADLGALLASLQRREFLLFKPGEPARVVSSLHHEHGPAIYLSKHELVFHNGIRTFHCRVGEAADPGLVKLPLVAKLVAVFVHHPPAGPGPARYVYALDGTQSVIAKVDDTGTWEFRSDLLEEACELVGLTYEKESFERVDDLLSSYPNLAEPKLEFEAHHPAEEAVRELSMGVFYGGLIAAGLVSSGGMALVFANPVGDVYKGLVALGCVIMCALTWWSLSGRRMRRSMRRAHSAAARAPSTHRNASGGSGR